MIVLDPVDAASIQLARLEQSDGEPLRRLFGRLSPETRYRRFMSPVVRPDQVHAERLLDIDHADREAVAALADGELVGVARYARQEGCTADFAVTVADDWQRHGAGRALLEQLAAAARGHGVCRFTGLALGENRPVLALLRRVFPGVRVRLQDGLLDIEVDLEQGPGEALGGERASPAPSDRVALREGSSRPPPQPRVLSREVL